MAARAVADPSGAVVSTEADADVVLSVQGLSRSFGEGSDRREILHDLRFDVRKEELVCVVGPSGAGKTTLLRCMAGLLPPSSGSVELDGVAVDGPPDGLALVFQDYSRSLLPWMSVEDNVLLPLRRLGLDKSERARRIGNALSEVGLSDTRQLYPWQMSGGMQQRAAIARALAYEPTALIMDEPFAAIDAQTRADLEDLTLKVKSDLGIPIIFVTHDIDEAVYLADRVIVLSLGPATVMANIQINLPHPRDQITTKADPEFVGKRARVFELIQQAKKSTQPGSGKDHS